MLGVCIVLSSGYQLQKRFMSRQSAKIAASGDFPVMAHSKCKLYYLLLLLPCTFTSTHHLTMCYLSPCPLSPLLDGPHLPASLSFLSLLLPCPLCHMFSSHGHVERNILSLPLLSSFLACLQTCLLSLILLSFYLIIHFVRFLSPSSSSSSSFSQDIVTVQVLQAKPIPAWASSLLSIQERQY